MASASDAITIRPATAGDAPVLCELLRQLGYPATDSEIPARLEAVSNFPCAAAFVATNGYGEVIGLATTHIFPSIHDNAPVAWLTSLVVLEDVRGAGVGSALVRHVEKWAVQNGAKRISVTSALHRARTHEFYLNRDYEQTGLRFSKKLGPNTAT
ncbi:MAG TPA: GNAT family N-acetyltransferase [Gemmatimonadaceae bacterium]|nr:GNAT family N-acetyltransferase [Gemmatimonadaceae bacterium]